MTIWFASGNAHKKAELAAVLAGHVIKTPADAGIHFEPEETGDTFAENALIKARSLHRLLAENGLAGPVIADDSGLCVDALDGRPGVYSARYGSENGIKLNDGQRNALLLEELGTAASRSARFVCAMVLLYTGDRFFIAQETLEGEIVASAERVAGTRGFGYDPILYIPEQGRTVAELAEEEKNRISHRGKAGRLIARLLAGD